MIPNGFTHENPPMILFNGCYLLSVLENNLFNDSNTLLAYPEVSYRYKVIEINTEQIIYLFSYFNLPNKQMNFIIRKVHEEC